MQAIFNQFVYFAYFQSIFLILIFLFSPKKRQYINKYVVFLVAVLIIGLTGRIFYISEVFGRNFRLVAFSEFATLLFGSTIYLFTRSSLQNKPFSYQDLLHYVPGFVYSLLVVFLFMLPSDEAISARLKSGELFRTITLFIGFGLVFNIAYWLMSCHVFWKVRKNLQNELSYVAKTQFFFNFLLSIGICLLSWVVVYFISIFADKNIEIAARQFIWLGIALIILFIAYYGIAEPNLFKILPPDTNRKYVQSKLSVADLDRLKERLEQLMQHEKPYLNRKLLKAELAEMLGVSNPEIARLLNERIGMNFFEYVNYYRIKEFIALAQTEQAKSLTFFGLAQEAGFNSKTTFNKSFKKLMGKSPKQYLSEESIS